MSSATSAEYRSDTPPGTKRARSPATEERPQLRQRGGSDEASSSSDGATPGIHGIHVDATPAPSVGLNIAVISGDLYTFTVDRAMFCAASTFVRNAAQDTELDELRLPPWLEATSLRHALQHTRWHASNPSGTEAAAAWDASFVRQVSCAASDAAGPPSASALHLPRENRHAPELLLLLRAASFLEMEALLGLLCREVCAGMRRHSHAQLRRLFPMLATDDGATGAPAQLVRQQERQGVRRRPPPPPPPDPIRLRLLQLLGQMNASFPETDATRAQTARIDARVAEMLRQGGWVHPSQSSHGGGPSSSRPRAGVATTLELLALSSAQLAARAPGHNYDASSATATDSGGAGPSRPPSALGAPSAGGSASDLGVDGGGDGDGQGDGGDGSSTDDGLGGLGAIGRTPGCVDALEAHLSAVSEAETLRLLHTPHTAVPALAALQVARALRAADWGQMAPLRVLKRLPNRRSTTTTYEVVHRETATRAVLKQVRLDPEGVPVVVLREVALMKTLQHPNLVQLKGAWHGKDEIDGVDADGNPRTAAEAAASAARMAALAAELTATLEGRTALAAGGAIGDTTLRLLSPPTPLHPNLPEAVPCISLVYEHVELNMRLLVRRLAPSATLPLPAVQAVAYQALRGLAWCHANGVLHRDVTPHNLRYCPYTGVVKLTGFELAREIGSVGKPSKCLTHEVVTLWYRAPEVLLGAQHYSTPLDAWSMGTVIAELATGLPLLPGDSEIGQLNKTFQLLGTPTEESWPGISRLPHWMAEFPKWKPAEGELDARLAPLEGSGGVDLVRRLMAHDPRRRLTLHDAMAHPFFADLDKVNVGTAPLAGMPIHSASSTPPEQPDAI